MGCLIVVMGVSGSGKSTIAKALGQKLSCVYLDADDFHPESNVDKMTAGNPLTDGDRKQWVNAINEHIVGLNASPVILACSALTPFVQASLDNESNRKCIWLQLDGPPDLIKTRIEARRGHFMTSELLDSQFEAMIPPRDAIMVSIEPPVHKIVEKIVDMLATV